MDAEPRPGDDPDDRRPQSRRRTWLVIGVLVVVGLSGAGFLFGQKDGGDDPTTGRIAPEFTLPELRGDGQVALARLRGQPVVVNFFASWCVPCRKEMAAFQAVSTRLSGKVAFIGVDHNDDRKGGQQLLIDTGVRYPTGYDPEGKVAESYGLFGMPTTLFIGPDGRLLEKHTGELSEEKLEDAIARLFAIS